MTFSLTQVVGAALFAFLAGVEVATVTMFWCIDRHRAVPRTKRLSAVRAFTQQEHPQ